MKPANVLVGANERGKLADFDISVDSGIRTTQQYLATTRRVGWTPGFEAPELRERGGRNTAASDMFAFGRTVASLGPACSEGARPSAEFADLVRLLTAEAAEERPSADAAAAHAFFRPLVELQRAQVSVCCICLEMVRHADGALCAEGHLSCRECLDGHVRTCAEDDLRALRRRGGRVLCPRNGALGCKAIAWSDSELGQAVAAAVFEGYLRGRRRLLETQMF